MDLDFTEEQQLLRETIRSLLQKYSAPEIVRRYFDRPRPVAVGRNRNSDVVLAGRHAQHAWRAPRRLAVDADNPTRWPRGHPDETPRSRFGRRIGNGSGSR